MLMMMFQENKLTGPAALFAASGERIEFEYQDGVVHGPAKIRVFGELCLLAEIENIGGNFWWNYDFRWKLLAEL